MGYTQQMIAVLEAVVELLLSVAAMFRGIRRDRAAPLGLIVPDPF